MSVLEMLVNEWIEEVKTRPALSGGSLVTGSHKWQIFSLLFLFIILQWLFLRNNNQLLNLNKSISSRFSKNDIFYLCVLYILCYHHENKKKIAKIDISVVFMNIRLLIKTYLKCKRCVWCDVCIIALCDIQECLFVLLTILQTVFLMYLSHTHLSHTILFSLLTVIHYLYLFSRSTLATLI